MRGRSLGMSQMEGASNPILSRELLLKSCAVGFAKVFESNRHKGTYENTQSNQPIKNKQNKTNCLSIDFYIEIRNRRQFKFNFKSIDSLV